MNHEPQSPATNPPTKEGWEEKIRAIYQMHLVEGIDTLSTLIEEIRTLLAQARSEERNAAVQYIIDNGEGIFEETGRPNEVLHTGVKASVEVFESARNDTSV